MVEKLANTAGSRIFKQLRTSMLQVVCKVKPNEAFISGNAEYTVILPCLYKGRLQNGKSGGSLSDAGDRDHGYHAEDGALWNNFSSEYYG